MNFMSGDAWHVIIELSKLLIAPMVAVLGYFLSGVKSSLKQLESDISEIKNSLSVNQEKVSASEKHINELRARADRHDEALLEFYKEMRKA